MKGYLASIFPSTDGKYSDLQVMQSPAGWYVGTIFHNNDGFNEPGSRESEYFESQELAQQALDNESWTQRENP